MPGVSNPPFISRNGSGALLACQWDRVSQRELLGRIPRRPQPHKESKDSTEFQENKRYHLQTTEMLDVKIWPARCGGLAEGPEAHVGIRSRSAARIAELTEGAEAYSRLLFLGRHSHHHCLWLQRTLSSSQTSSSVSGHRNYIRNMPGGVVHTIRKSFVAHFFPNM